MFYVTIDANSVVQEAFSDDNSNVPDGALPITDIEFKQLSQGFVLFKHDGNSLAINAEEEERRLKIQLVAIEREKVIENLISAKKTQINAMPKDALELAIKNGGI